VGGRLDEEGIFKRGGEECKERKENFVNAEDTEVKEKKEGRVGWVRLKF
jgi:hypothetical protein